MPSTLTYMDAFQAAIMISLPFDDRAWEILKPRLLSQRLQAEQQEHRIALNDPFVQQEKRQQLEEEQRVARENTSHMWDALKVPSREKLRTIAEDFIRLTWSDGGAVTRATASKFAAEVLTHIRHRFDESIAQEDHMLALKGTAFPQDSESMACRKLKLQDLKWAFVEFVQPHTQPFGKELFLCHVCDTNQKLFAFEAIIQHFASKHTNALSHGTSIVSWEAEWPADPLFDPHPNIPWALGGTESVPKSNPQQQSRSVLSRGLPSVSEKDPSIGYAVPRTFTKSIEQPGQPTPADFLPGYADPFRVDYGIRGRPGPFTHSSVARSETSALIDDEYQRHRPGVVVPQRDAPASHYHRVPLSSERLAEPLPYREPGVYSRPTQESDTANWWGAWREEHPVSHSSVVYSHEDSSSRFSRGGSLVRTRGIGSDAGRESEATSHFSFHKDKGLEAEVLYSGRAFSRASIDQVTASGGTVDDFLNSFDPMAIGAMSDRLTAPADAVYSPGQRLARHRIVSQPAGDLNQQYSSRSRLNSPPSAGHFPPLSPPAQRSLLPIRESERHIEQTLEPPPYSGHSPPPRQAPHSYEGHRRPASGGMYQENDGRQHPIRYGSTAHNVRDVLSTYSEPLYEGRYFYDREGRRYEEIRETGSVGYPMQLDRVSGRGHEVYLPDGGRYVDERDRFLDRGVNRENYVRMMPRGYQISDLQHRSQNASPINNQYDDDEPPVMQHRSRTIGFDHGDEIYQPAEPTTRPTARPLGRSLPDS
jgi:hypothetical protein